jgi:hypothetical protein
VQAEDESLVERLLTAGAKVASAGRHNGLTPLGVAMLLRNDRLAATLRDAGDSIDSIASPLLVGLAILSTAPGLAKALDARGDLPTRTIPDWPALGAHLLRDSTALTAALGRRVRPDARLLRYTLSFQEVDSASGSLLELLLKAASEDVRTPGDAPRVDALLSARLRSLQRHGVLPALAARLDDHTPGGRLSAPVLTMSVGLRRSTLALVSASSAPLGRRDGGLLLGLAMCQRDAAVAAAARKRGARAFPVAEQRELCLRVRVP